MIKGGGKISRISDKWIEKVEEALSLKLFLVNESGPTNLLFKDENGSKFRIKISSQITCSCSKSTTQRCKHVLFCLIKVFKVSQKSDLLFKMNLNDQNINQILEGRFKKRTNSKKKFDYLRSKTKNSKGKNRNSNTKEKRNFDKEDPCPICYEDIGEDGIHRCKTCENPFHLGCLVTWAKHQTTTKGNKATQCPMCRSKWDGNASVTLKKMQGLLTAFKKREYLHQRKCSGCAKNQIIGNIYRCLWCPQTYFCSECFDNSVHPKHVHYLFKEKTKDKWKPCTKRLRGCSKEVGLVDFLVESLANCDNNEKEKGSKAGGLSIVGFNVNSKQCVRCSKIYDQLGSIKRLPCGHKLCKECLRRQFRKKQFWCESDGLPIFRGLASNPRPPLRGNSSVGMSAKKRPRVEIPKKKRPSSYRKKKSSQARRKSRIQVRPSRTSILPPLGNTTKVRDVEALREKARNIKKLRQRKEALPPRRRTFGSGSRTGNLELNVITSKVTNFNF